MLPEDIGHMFEMADPNGEQDPARTNAFASVELQCQAAIARRKRSD
jgi:hypothetical protein